VNRTLKKELGYKPYIRGLYFIVQADFADYVKISHFSKDRYRWKKVLLVIIQDYIQKRLKPLYDSELTSAFKADETLEEKLPWILMLLIFPLKGGSNKTCSKKCTVPCTQPCATPKT